MTIHIEDLRAALLPFGVRDMERVCVLLSEADADEDDFADWLKAYAESIDISLADIDIVAAVWHYLCYEAAAENRGSHAERSKIMYRMQVEIEGKERHNMSVSNDTEFDSVVEQLKALHKLNATGKVTILVNPREAEDTQGGKENKNA